MANVSGGHDNGRLGSHKVVYSSSRSCFTARRQRVAEGKRHAKEVVRMTSGNLAITLAIAVPVLVGLGAQVTVAVRVRFRIACVRVNCGPGRPRVISIFAVVAAGSVEAGGSTSVTADVARDERAGGTCPKAHLGT